MAHPQANPSATRQPKRNHPTAAENQRQSDHEPRDPRQGARIERIGPACRLMHLFMRFFGGSDGPDQFHEASNNAQNQADQDIARWYAANDPVPGRSAIRRRLQPEK